MSQATLLAGNAGYIRSCAIEKGRCPGGAPGFHILRL